MVKHFEEYILLLAEFRFNKMFASMLKNLCGFLVCNLGTIAQLEAINN